MPEEARIVRTERWVNGQKRAASDVFITDETGRQFYTRDWPLLDNTPHQQAAELQAFHKRRAQFGY